MKIALVVVAALVVVLFLCSRIRRRRILPTEVVHQDDVTIVMLGSDALPHRSQTKEMLEVLTRVVEDGARRLIVDLSRSGDYLDDISMGILIQAMHRGQKEGEFRMVVVCPSAPMRGFFAMSKIDIILDVADNPYEAMAKVMA